MVAGPVVLLATVGAAGLVARANNPKGTKCLDSMNAFRAAVEDVRELDEEASDKLTTMTMKQNFCKKR